MPSPKKIANSYWFHGDFSLHANFVLRAWVAWSSKKQVRNTRTVYAGHVFVVPFSVFCVPDLLSNPLCLYSLTPTCVLCISQVASVACLQYLFLYIYLATVPVSLSLSLISLSLSHTLSLSPPSLCFSLLNPTGPERVERVKVRSRGPSEVKVSWLPLSSPS